MKKRSIDFNGIGQAKVKAIKRTQPEEPVSKHQFIHPVKKENKKADVSIKPQKEKAKIQITEKKYKTDESSVFRKNLIERLIPELRSEYNLPSFNVYYADNGSYPRRIYGDELESEIVIERCLSYINPVVIINPNGITDNRIYKSRFVTRLYTENGMYLICASSYSIEAFRNNAGERIIQKICKLFNPYSDGELILGE